MGQPTQFVLLPYKQRLEVLFGKLVLKSKTNRFFVKIKHVFDFLLVNLLILFSLLSLEYHYCYFCYNLYRCNESFLVYCTIPPSILSVYNNTNKSHEELESLTPQCYILLLPTIYSHI